MSGMHFLAGVDGGGTGTRLRLANAQGVELALGHAGPSSLAHGVPEAWAAILSALHEAFGNAGMAPPPLAAVALGAGLAGVNVPDCAEPMERVWKPSTLASVSVLSA